MGYIVELPIQICNHLICIHAFILSIAEVDVVIGAAWLETLGPHVADYSTTTIHFVKDGQFVTLNGLKNPPLTQAQLNSMVRITKLEAAAELFVFKSAGQAG